MSWLLDPDAVATEYESEQALRERVLAQRELIEGPDDESVVRTRIVAARPQSTTLTRCSRDPCSHE
jgi:hypothetical protein